MTKIESNKAYVKKGQKELFTFLSDMNNFARLLPSDKIENVVTTDKTCSFRINGMADISLVKKRETPNYQIEIESGEKTPFKFTLNIYITEETDYASCAQLVFEGHLNPMLKLMVETPLTNFFNMLASKLETVF
ncbi:MAG: hypothetical protein HUU48_05860 [Flavobacteriales bacterium]|nr:hypothetical protein [Flavobacteriales bacterium]